MATVQPAQPAAIAGSVPSRDSTIYNSTKFVLAVAKNSVARPAARRARRARAAAAARDLVPVLLIQQGVVWDKKWDGELGQTPLFD